MASPVWLHWADVSWSSDSLVRLAERLTESAEQAATTADFLQVILPDLLVELGASSATVCRRDGQWQTIARGGRDGHDAPTKHAQTFAEVLDRDAAVKFTLDRDTAIITPIAPLPPTLLLVRGERIPSDALPAALAMGRLLGSLLPLVQQREECASHAQRLRQTLELAQSFSRERETTPLLELMARRATDLLGCDRASIFIWDREQRQLVACPALGVEGGRLFLPDDKGIVGEVIRSGQPVQVDDAYADPRFDQSVDRQSGYRTSSLLCVPMLDSDRRVIGAFELINKRSGAFTATDREALEELCIHAAIAVQHARERDLLVRSNQQLTEQVTGQSAIIGESSGDRRPAGHDRPTRRDRSAGADSRRERHRQGSRRAGAALSRAAGRSIRSSRSTVRP